MSSYRFQLLVNLLRNAFVLLHREREGAIVQGCVRKYGKSSARDGRLSLSFSCYSFQINYYLYFLFIFAEIFANPKYFLKIHFCNKMTIIIDIVLAAATLTRSFFIISAMMVCSNVKRREKRESWTIFHLSTRHVCLLN